MSAALEAQAVSKRYGRQVWALRNVDLSLDRGGVIGLVGPNGAGKSTLLKLWTGFERRTEGEVTVLGLDPWSDRRRVLPRIAYLGQDPGLYRDLTAADHLDFVAHYRRASFDRKRALQRLNDLRVPTGRKLRSLSGGQMAQVGLAICLGMRAEILLLDEPLTSLDPLARREFLSVLTADVAESSATVVLSSHDVADLGRACSRLVVLGVGRVRLAGDIQQILSTHRVSSEETPGSSPVAQLPSGLTLFVSATGPLQPSERPTLEDIVLGTWSLIAKSHEMNLLRIWVRRNQFLLACFTILTFIAAGAAIAYSATITCAADLSASECRRFLNSNPPSTAATAALALLPVIVGLFFGVEAVGREIDEHTVGFAWFVAGNRITWLAWRVFPGLLVTVVIGLVCGAANAVVVSDLNPGRDLPNSFVGYGLWGPLLVFRAFCAYGVGLLIGALSGRPLAAIVLSLILLTAILPGALLVGRELEPTVFLRNGDPRWPDALGVGFGALAPDGRFIDSLQCASYAPPGLDPSTLSLWAATNCPFVSTALLGPQLPSVEMREASVLGLIAIGSAGGTALVVARRRP